ncbi:MAG TPA: response regulator [Terriglobales bacterium]|nr:response regulator [Terriglobales bacterium]
MPVSPKHILNVAATEALRETRELLLKQMGYLVVSATNIRELSHVCRRSLFDLAIIGHGFDPAKKKRIAAIIRQHCPGTPLLEMCRVSPEIPDSEFVLHGADPQDLVNEVNAILRGDARKG